MAVSLDKLASYALFAEVVRLSSFSAAGRHVGIAKSAVSKRIAQLERELGVTLLRRSTRKLVLTPDGMRFYEHCQKLLDSANDAERAVRASSESLRGPLRVSAPITFGQLYLAEACAAFLKQRPEVELTMLLDDRLVDVVTGEFDVVIRVGRAGQVGDASYVARKLALDRLVVCAAPSYLARAGRPETPAELVHHNCLHYELVARAAEWRFRAADGPVAVPVRGSLNVNDGTFLRESALAGLGLVVLPYFMVASDVARGRLELVLEGQRKAQLALFAVTGQARNLPRRTSAFLEHLTRWFKTPRWS